VSLAVWFVAPPLMVSSPALVGSHWIVVSRGLIGHDLLWFPFCLVDFGLSNKLDLYIWKFFSIISLDALWPGCGCQT
jgi:hypothetical protein